MWPDRKTPLYGDNRSKPSLLAWHTLIKHWKLLVVPTNVQNTLMKSQFTCIAELSSSSSILTTPNEQLSSNRAMNINKHAVKWTLAGINCSDYTSDPHPTTRWWSDVNTYRFSTTNEPILNFEHIQSFIEYRYGTEYTVFQLVMAFSMIPLLIMRPDVHTMASFLTCTITVQPIARKKFLKAQLQWWHTILSRFTD